MYTPIKDLMSAYTIARLDGDTYDFNRQLYLLPPKEPGVGVKIVAGMTSGAVASCRTSTGFFINNQGHFKGRRHPGFMERCHAQHGTGCNADCCPMRYV
jgi:hypothetical protein